MCVIVCMCLCVPIHMYSLCVKFVLEVGASKGLVNTV